MQTAEQDFVNRIKLSRGTAEPSPEAPTENTEAVNVSEDAPIEEVVEPEAIANEEVTSEIEEPAEEVTASQANDEETDLFYYDIDGEEVSSTQLKEWKDNGLMQADYTRKTQSHAEDVKTFKVKEDDFAAKQSEFNDKLAQLNAMIEEDTPSAEVLAEWREYEPEKYIEHTEKMSNRKKLLASSKAELPTQSVDMVKVSADLAASHPEWMENGKQSKQFITDTNLMTSYAESRGISQADMTSFDARHYEIILDAARYKSQNSKNVAIEKKIRKAPVSTKPRAAASGIQTDLEAAQKAFKNNPTDKNAVALRKLKRQLNN
jgi:hypothetical protein